MCVSAIYRRGGVTLKQPREAVRYHSVAVGSFTRFEERPRDVDCIAVNARAETTDPREETQ